MWNNKWHRLETIHITYVYEEEYIYIHVLTNKIFHSDKATKLFMIDVGRFNMITKWNCDQNFHIEHQVFYGIQSYKIIMENIGFYLLILISYLPSLNSMYVYYTVKSCWINCFIWTCLRVIFRNCTRFYLTLKAELSPMALTMMSFGSRK